MLRYKRTIFSGIGSEIEKPISTASLLNISFICTLVLRCLGDCVLQCVLRQFIYLLELRVCVCVCLFF